MINCFGFNNQKKYLLENYNNNKLHNSIILTGEKGVGKKTFVFDLLKNIIEIKLEQKEIDHNINLLFNNTHPNIKYIFKEIDQKTKKIRNAITIDQIRGLSAFVNETSLSTKLSKFIIIDSADDMNNNSANSLLKILEEPKLNTFIFLISHNISSLLLTVRSRCLKVKMLNHDYDNFKTILLSNININNEEQIKFLYDLTNGSPGKALNLYDEEILDIFEELVNSISDNNNITLTQVKLCKKLAQYDNDKFSIFVSILKFILINVYKLNLGVNIFDYFSTNVSKILISVSKNISNESILNRLEYLITNENNLFSYNLDKNLFMLNFFTKN